MTRSICSWLVALLVLTVSAPFSAAGDSAARVVGVPDDSAGRVVGVPDDSAGRVVGVPDDSAGRVVGVPDDSAGRAAGVPDDSAGRVVGVPDDSAGREPFIVSAAWLAEHINDKDLVLFHVGDPAEYQAAHIPGAIFISTRDISTPRGQGLTLQLPSVEQSKETFETFGVSDSSRIIVYFGKDWVTPSARVLLTLEYLGLGDRASMLDGGMPVWIAEKHPVTAELKQPARGSITPKPRPETIADAAWVFAHLQDPAVTIVDARTANFYAGEPGIFPRGGHIPGAISIPFPSLLEPEPSTKLLNVAAMAEVFRAAGVKPGAEVVTYCHIGQQASFVYLVARMLGFKARMYDGSFEEWSQKPELPVDSPKPAPKPDPKP
jgi:thiosulfate/3-mercaptopyruvate sulfurtransferase